MFAVATTPQHRAARQAPQIGGGARRAGRALAGVLLRPMWPAGLVADVAGFGPHVYALTTGELAVVQPLLVIGLLYRPRSGGPPGRSSHHCQPTRVGRGCGGLLGVFLVLPASPAGGRTRAGTGRSGGDRVAGRRGRLLAGGCQIRAEPPRGLLFGLTAALIGWGPARIGVGGGAHPLANLRSAAGRTFGVAGQPGRVPGRSAVGEPSGEHRGRPASERRAEATAVREATRQPLAATLEALVLIVLAVALLRLARTEHDPPEPQPALPTSRLSMNANTGCGKDG